MLGDTHAPGVAEAPSAEDWTTALASHRHGGLLRGLRSDGGRERGTGGRKLPLRGEKLGVGGGWNP